jgi:hypothetical protein
MARSLLVAFGCEGSPEEQEGKEEGDRHERD